MVDFIDINGATLAYRLVGPQNRPLFITLHGGRGFGDHASDFKAYAPFQTTHRILSFDYRGHGKSSVTKPFTFQQLVQDIESLKTHFVGPGPENKVIICGGSFGGYLAQQYAIEYPSHVSHLILRGTAPSYHRPLYSESYDANIALQKTLETVFRAETHNDLYSPSEKFFDYRDRLHLITAKTLIIVGEKDWICPPGHIDQSKIIASGIPGSRLEVVPKANHSVHLEKNKEVLDMIRGFLDVNSVEEA